MADPVRRADNDVPVFTANGKPWFPVVSPENLDPLIGLNHLKRGAHGEEKVWFCCCSCEILLGGTRCCKGCPPCCGRKVSNTLCVAVGLAALGPIGMAAFGGCVAYCDLSDFNKTGAEEGEEALGRAFFRVMFWIAFFPGALCALCILYPIVVYMWYQVRWCCNAPSQRPLNRSVQRDRAETKALLDHD